MTRDIEMKKTTSNSYFLRDPPCCSVTPSMQLFSYELSFLYPRWDSASIPLSGHSHRNSKDAHCSEMAGMAEAYTQDQDGNVGKMFLQVNGKLNIAINRQSYYLSFHI